MAAPIGESNILSKLYYIKNVLPSTIWNIPPDVVALWLMKVLFVIFKLNKTWSMLKNPPLSA